MNFGKIIKNKYLWLIVIVIFIGYQIIQDASVYKWTGYENLSAVSEGNIKAASEAGGKQAD